MPNCVGPTGKTEGNPPFGEKILGPDPEVLDFIFSVGEERIEVAGKTPLNKDPEELLDISSISNKVPFTDSRLVPDPYLERRGRGSGQDCRGISPDCYTINTMYVVN